MIDVQMVRENGQASKKLDDFTIGVSMLKTRNIFWTQVITAVSPSGYRQDPKTIKRMKELVSWRWSARTINFDTAVQKLTEAGYKDGWTCS